jgi:hypothetical protein
VQSKSGLTIRLDQAELQTPLLFQPDSHIRDRLESVVSVDPRANSCVRSEATDRSITKTCRAQAHTDDGRGQLRIALA